MTDNEKFINDLPTGAELDRQVDEWLEQCYDPNNLTPSREKVVVAYRLILALKAERNGQGSAD